jgi:hypothetical protein
MPSYMTQKMSSGSHKAILYYRKQTQPHVTHTESGKFTTDATNAYMATYNITDSSKVELGDYKSGQGRPQNGEEI